MSTSLITRCPKCSTAFRVSEDMLNMAKGKVRCGQCFHIFKAQDHQIAEADKTTKAEAPNTKTSVSPPLKKANQAYSPTPRAGRP